MVSQTAGWLDLLGFGVYKDCHGRAAGHPSAVNLIRNRWRFWFRIRRRTVRMMMNECYSGPIQGFDVHCACHIPTRTRRPLAQPDSETLFGPTFISRESFNRPAVWQNGKLKRLTYADTLLPASFPSQVRAVCGPAPPRKPPSIVSHRLSLIFAGLYGRCRAAA